jgi:hypothetical protein
MVSPNDYNVMHHQNQTRTNGIWGHVRCNLLLFWWWFRGLALSSIKSLEILCNVLLSSTSISRTGALDWQCSSSAYTMLEQSRILWNIWDTSSELWSMFRAGNTMARSCITRDCSLESPSANWWLQAWGKSQTEDLGRYLLLSLCFISFAARFVKLWILRPCIRRKLFKYLGRH